jgi:two-component system OmpR family response regulator
MRLLLVEDTEALAGQITKALQEAAHAVDTASDGETAQHLGETEPYDAVILDLGIPHMDGLSLLRDWRARGVKTPVLILTARGEWSNKVEGLDAGADDYLAKPFVMEELIARVNALIRRSHGLTRAMFVYENLQIDLANKLVCLNGKQVRLTALEYELLSVLAHHQYQIVSKTHLTEHLYSQEFDRDSNTLEVIISRLRRKLSDDLIETVRGQGYRLGRAMLPA